MEVIKYERTWCDHLTPCPYLRGIMVGDWECNNCLHNRGNSVNRDKGEVLCSYKEKHQNEKEDVHSRLNKPTNCNTLNMQ